MQTAHKDVLFLLALELDVPDLLNLCLSSKRIDELICQRKDIWLHKLKPFYGVNTQLIEKDFNQFSRILNPTEYTTGDTKSIYKLLYSLNVIKQFLKSLDKDYSLMELYNLQDLDMAEKQIKEIPRDFAQALVDLPNLRILSVDNNQITEIPKEIGDLINLRQLWLYDNQIREIPKELGKLINLHSLSLTGNQIRELPEELGNLINLESLYLGLTDIEEIPEKLKNNENVKIYL